MNTRVNRFILWTAVLLTIGFTAEPASRAETATVQATEPKVLQLTSDRGAFPIPTRDDVEVRIRFPRDIRGLTSPIADHPRYKVDYSWDELRITMEGRPSKPATLNLHVDTGRENVSLQLHEVSSSERVPSLYDVRTASEEEKRQRVAREVIAYIVAWMEAEGATRESEFARAAASAWKSPRALMPRTQRSVDNECLHVEVEHAGRQGSLFVVAIEMENISVSPCVVRRYDVFDSDGNVRETGPIALEGPRTAAPDVIAAIPPGRRVRAGVAVRGVEGESFEPIAIALGTANQAQPALVVVEQWGASVPLIAVDSNPSPLTLADGSAEHSRRDIAGVPMSFQLNLRGGSIWLGSGPASDELAAVGLVGLGLRATYRIDRNFAIDGDVIGAASGAARFGSVSADGTQTELVRSARLGRAQVSGALRPDQSRRVRPSVHLSVGVQGTSYSSESMAAGDNSTERERSFELDMTIGVGAAVDVQFSKRLLAGAGLSYVDRLNSGERAMECVLYAGYSLEP